MYYLVLLLAILGTAPLKGPNGQPPQRRLDRTMVVTKVPFCAFLLREFLDDDNSGRELYLLMEPDKVTEANLRILFKMLPEAYEQAIPLRIWVYTDVKQLASLATSSGHSEFPDADSKGSETSRWAYYKRTSAVELFRYGNGQRETEKITIILRGHE